jgi:hypothetical protein
VTGKQGNDVQVEVEWRDLLAALHRAVDEELTLRQREVFVAIVLNDVPRPRRGAVPGHRGAPARMWPVR